MATTDTGLTTMQIAFIKAGKLTEDRAYFMNQIQREKDRKVARKFKQQTAANNNVTNFRDRLRKTA